jgi:tetratricopeptide (TPR) repeat protein
VFARRLLIDWGLVLYAMGDFPGGLARLDESIAMARRSQGNAPLPPAILANRAFGLEQLGRFDEAMAAYDEAREAAERTGVGPWISYALTGRANVMATRGDTAGAWQALESSDRFAGKIPDSHPVRIRLAMVRARVEAARGRLREGADGFTRVIRLMSEQGLTHPALANAYRQRADIVRRQGDLEGARADAERALALAQKLQGESRHSDLTGLAWLTLGQVLRDAREPARSRDAFVQADANLANTVGSGHPDAQLARRLLAGN